MDASKTQRIALASANSSKGVVHKKLEMAFRYLLKGIYLYNCVPDMLRFREGAGVLLWGLDTCPARFFCALSKISKTQRRKIMKSASVLKMNPPKHLNETFNLEMNSLKAAWSKLYFLEKAVSLILKDADMQEEAVGLSEILFDTGRSLEGIGDRLRTLFEGRA